MSEQDAVEKKKAARRRVRRQLAQMPPDVARRKSLAACEALVGLDEFARADTVMAYMAIPGEVDTTPILERAWREGKTVLLPKVRADAHEMMAAPYRTVDDPMVVGRYNIREPAREDAWPVGRIDFIVVPALAYDANGNRLGKGGGYYDRFLSQPGMHAVMCGLAFAEQVIESLTVEGHDRKVDLLVTDEGVRRFRATPEGP